MDLNNEVIATQNWSRYIQI